MNKPYDIIVYIGRFQPFHNAHEETLERANELAKKVIVIVGSSFQPRTYKNPFTFEEREAMIPLDLADAVIPMRDSMYNDQAWAIRVQGAVYEESHKFFPNETVKIGIIGHEKDETSFYLKMFPQWDHINVGLLEHVHATNIRSMYFTNNMTMAYLRGVIPIRVYDQLALFSTTEEFKQIVRERDFIKEYKKQGFKEINYVDKDVYSINSASGIITRTVVLTDDLLASQRHSRKYYLEKNKRIKGGIRPV